MRPPSAPRRAADALLLASGPQEREALMELMMPMVEPGKAHRMTAYQREKNCVGDPQPSRRGDDSMVGRKAVCTKTIGNALRTGTWVALDDGRISHRDWREPVVAALAAPSTRGLVIPALDAGAVALSALLASDWGKAALCAAYVSLDNQPGPRSATSSRSMTPREFAEIGIPGLKSKDTVRRHVCAWQSTGLPVPVVGEPVTLPTVEFSSWSGHAEPALAPELEQQTRRRTRVREQRQVTYETVVRDMERAYDAIGRKDFNRAVEFVRRTKQRTNVVDASRRFA